MAIMAKMYEVGPCQFCGHYFLTSDNNSRFCSRKCELEFEAEEEWLRQNLHSL